ncbi:GSCOCG00001153001-RA-CDS [Cotesia congregata]|nr:GSCOCG00001153001-RA-CDS [Cotesia congregata]
MDTVDGESRRQPTRVFKKPSNNGKITVYLSKRDFVDHMTHIDPIGNKSFLIVSSIISINIDYLRCIFNGVVLIDPEYVKERKVFGNVLAHLRFGREDLDVLGLIVKRELHLATDQKN